MDDLGDRLVEHQDALVSDGALYQAMRMDGKEFTPLTDDAIVKTADRFETYIRCGCNPERQEMIEFAVDALDQELAKIPDELQGEDVRQPGPGEE